MPSDLYKKILADKGTNKKDTTNNPLSLYISTEEDDAELGFYSSNVITLNLLFSGRVDGAIPIGKMSMISAPSMLGKTMIAMSIAKSAQRKNKNLFIVVVDTERSFDFNLAKKFGIDVSKEKLIVYRENGIEEVKNIILKTIELIPREDRKDILIIFDSWGTLVSSKSIDDGLQGKDVVDMTMPKKKNDLANILLNTKCTAFVVNHVYDNTGGFGDPLVIPGGRRIVFDCSSVVLATSRAKEKDKDKNVTGHIISAQTFKSRYSKDKSELQFRIKHKGGLDIFFGLLDDALEGGFVEPGRILDEKAMNKKEKDGKKKEDVWIEKSGTYMRSHIKNDTPIKEEDIYTSDFWFPIFKETNFKEYLEKKYQFTTDLDINTNEDILKELI